MFFCVVVMLTGWCIIHKPMRMLRNFESNVDILHEKVKEVVQKKKQEGQIMNNNNKRKREFKEPDGDSELKVIEKKQFALQSK